MDAVALFEAVGNVEADTVCASHPQGDEERCAGLPIHIEVAPDEDALALGEGFGKQFASVG